MTELKIVESDDEETDDDDEDDEEDGDDEEEEEDDDGVDLVVVDDNDGKGSVDLEIFTARASQSPEKEIIDVVAKI